MISLGDLHLGSANKVNLETSRSLEIVADIIA